MQLENPIATTENCRYCLMCRHVAPVGHVTNNEALTPHGIALTVASQRRGLIDWTPEAVGVVYAEPDGGNCRAHCVTDQPLPAAIAAVRAELTAQNLAPAVVYEIHEKLTSAHSPYGEDAPDPTTDTGDTALFVGDEAYYLWPDAAESAATLLEAAGLPAVPIGRGRSNGFLASSLGFPDTARAQAEALFDELRATGATRLIALSPGDVFTFRQLYPERLGIEWPDDIDLVDLVSLLADRLDDGALAFEPADDPEPYAYVDPTHAVRVPERFAAARRLAEAVTGAPPRELFWRRERAHPVGSTALQFTRPDLARLLTEARLEDARETGAGWLLCEDPGTLHQLARHAEGTDLRVRGLYDLLAAQLADA